MDCVGVEFLRFWLTGYTPAGTLMPQRRKYTRSPQQSQVRKHISQASITRNIVKPYMSAMKLFYKWRKAQGLTANPDFPEFDLQLGEYRIFLYQGDMPSRHKLCRWFQEISPSLQAPDRDRLLLVEQLVSGGAQSPGDASAC